MPSVRHPFPWSTLPTAESTQCCSMANFLAFRKLVLSLYKPSNKAFMEAWMHRDFSPQVHHHPPRKMKKEAILRRLLSSRAETPIRGATTMIRIACILTSRSWVSRLKTVSLTIWNLISTWCSCRKSFEESPHSAMCLTRNAWKSSTISMTMSESASNATKAIAFNTCTKSETWSP